MVISRRGKDSEGFTLLEVLMATVLLAAGSVSIIMVLTAAAASARSRIDSKRLSEVRKEALRYAQSEVDAFVPTERVKVPGKRPEAPARKPGAKDEDAAAVEDDGTEIESTLYRLYGFSIAYAPVDPAAPDAGFEARISIRVNGKEVDADDVIVARNSILQSEFETSITYEQERKGTDDTDTGSETK